MGGVAPKLWIGMCRTVQCRAKFRAKSSDALGRACCVYSVLRLEIRDGGVLIPDTPRSRPEPHAELEFWQAMQPLGLGEWAFCLLEVCLPNLFLSTVAPFALQIVQKLVLKSTF